MRVRLLSISLAALLAVAVAAPATAITGGTPDGTNHPYVGILEISIRDAAGVVTPTLSCTGSLLSPTVVLTAAHCLSYFGEVAAIRAWFAPELSGTPQAGPPYNGDPTSSGGIDAASWHVFPDYRFIPAGNYTTYFFGDFGVVILEEPVPTNLVNRYAQLPEVGIVDTLPSQTAVDLVGWGVQFQEKTSGNSAPRFYGVLMRYYAQTELISGNFMASDSLMKLSQNKGGFCYGDSGGPDVLGGTDTVLAVNDFGNNTNCAGIGYGTRLDLQARLDWINGFLPQ